MPAKEEKSKIVSLSVNKPTEKKTDLSLLILGALLLITLASVCYLYFNLKSAQKKPEFFGQKSFTTTDVSLKEKEGQTRQKNKLIPYKDEQLRLSLSYPANWGPASSEDVAGRKTIQLGPDSNFSVVVGPHPDPNTGQPMKVSQLLAEGVIKEGCQQSEKVVSNHPAIIVTCERTANSSVQAYLQEGTTIYILFYRYDLTTIKTEEATTVFNLVLDSFKLL